AIDSRCVFGALGPNAVELDTFAIKPAKPALFTSGLAIVESVRLVATLFPIGEASGDGDGDGAALLVRGVSSRLIVFVRTPASEGAWREFRLTTPPRIPDGSL